MWTYARMGATVGVGLMLAAALPVARADAPGPLFALIDAAARRLQTADDVAAVKWTTGGSIQDPTRERQVLDAVATAATDRGVDPGFVRRVFRDQIDATVGVEYARFSDWKLDPAGAPTSAPDLATSRSAIDALNRAMVNEIALHWDSLRGPDCVSQLQASRDAVAAARQLDDLYDRALASATRSYCE